MIRCIYIGVFALGIASAFLALAPAAFASATDGTIDATNRWAWSENAGWIDFGTSGGGLQVTDSALTGYAYGENIGWISLNCSNNASCANNTYAVENDGAGNLSGFAWGENTGWVSFNPAGEGVTISSLGIFSGYAYAENIGWIVFATGQPVTTDWRPASVRTTATPAPAKTGGSGLVVGSGPLAPSAKGLSGYTPPRPQIIYPDGRVVYLDQPPAASSVPAQGGSVLGTSTTTSSLGVSPAPDISFDKNLQLYDQGADVLALQKFLNAENFTIATSGPGSAGQETLSFGGKTLKALERFQASVGLPPSGYFGPLTRAFINSHYQ